MLKYVLSHRKCSTILICIIAINFLVYRQVKDLQEALEECRRTSKVSISDVPIVSSVIGIGHYFNYRYRLFLKDVTDIVISVLIMSFLVIIASLIAFTILIIY